MARTYFLNPSSIQETQYHATLMALEAAVSALKPGASMAAPRSAAKRMLKHMGQVSDVVCRFSLSSSGCSRLRVFDQVWE